MAPHNFSSFFAQRHHDNFNGVCLIILPILLRLIALFSSNYSIPGVLSPSTSSLNVSNRTSWACAVGVSREVTVPLTFTSLVPRLLNSLRQDLGTNEVS